MAAIVFLLSVLVAAASGSPLDPLIVNGTEVSIDDFPFVVSIYKDNAFHSAGNIIGEKWVITEGRDLDGKDADRLTVYGGSSVHGSGEILKVSSISFDTGIKSCARKPCIAMLHFITGIKYSSTLNYISLPQADEETPHDKQATVIGWGSDSDANGMAQQKQLHAKNITLIADKDCAQAGYDSRQMCAKTTNEDATICLYDRGGPVWFNGTLYGIISQNHKDPCFDGSKKVPFHRVAFYRQWIYNETGV